MNIEIEKTTTIPDFPSGSGIAYSNQKVYAIGDDSPFLYVLDEDFKLIQKILLIDVDEENFKGNRIKKKKKPDFETLEIISDNELVVFGSGSKSPRRDIFVRILLGEEVTVKQYTISSFYDFLKQQPLLENSELNIEATAFSEGFLYLFNRTNNVIIRFDYHDFIQYLSNGNLPKVETKRVFLPEIQGVEAGFSGATTLITSKFIFTASVEATDDAYNDGEIIGSLLGELDFSDFQNAKITQFAELPNEKEAIKVESITLLPSKSTEKIKAILITDDDNGGTQLIKISIF